jgi:hypothetical protein
MGFYIPEDDIPHSHRRENLKPYIHNPQLVSSSRCLHSLSRVLPACKRLATVRSIAKQYPSKWLTTKFHGHLGYLTSVALAFSLWSFVHVPGHLANVKQNGMFGKPARVPEQNLFKYVCPSEPHCTAAGNKHSDGFRWHRETRGTWLTELP